LLLYDFFQQKNTENYDWDLLMFKHIEIDVKEDSKLLQAGDNAKICNGIIY